MQALHLHARNCQFRRIPSTQAVRIGMQERSEPATIRRLRKSAAGSLVAVLVATPKERRVKAFATEAAD